MSTKDDEFSELAAALWPRLLRTSVGLGLRVPDAEDLVQATLVRCYTKWALIRDSADPASYVFKVLLNTHRARARRQWRKEVPFGDPLTESPGSLDTAADPGPYVRLAVQRLPIKSREVVVLRLLLDLSEAQTADVLDVPPGTVKSRLARALVALGKDPEIVALERNHQSAH